MQRAASYLEPHTRPERTAILLVNLGTPEAPTPDAVRRYLRAFLTDPRVVPLPAWWWRPLLEWVILPRRAPKSAAKYQAIWTPEGSPLAVCTRRLAAALAEHYFPDDLYRVAYAMRYGSPSLFEALQKLYTEGMRRLLVVPLYPQFCSATTASVVDEVGAYLRSAWDLPELRVVRGFHNHPRWVARVAESIRAALGDDPPQRLIISFHGMPKETLAAGDPYFCHCHASARLIREALGWPAEQVVVGFQSRFGRAKWFEPDTHALLRAFAQDGIEDVAVVAPGFLCDCLETLEELNQEARSSFLAAGGRRFRYVPCLNSDPAWVADLAQIIREHLAGWPEKLIGEEELAERAARAQALEA